MFNKIQDPLALLARILLVLLFITSGFGKIGHFDGTVSYIAAKGLQPAALGAIIAIVVEFGGGLAVLVGFFTRWVALAMAIFTVAAAVFFHNYWSVPADQVMNMQIHFWKNVSIAGGFLMIVAFGPGAYSLDARRGR